MFESPLTLLDAFVVGAVGAGLWQLLEDGLADDDGGDE